MKFKIEIELGNDAMQTEEHLANELRQIAKKLERRIIMLESDDGSYPSGPLRDMNGNKVGEWEVCES